MKGPKKCRSRNITLLRQFFKHAFFYCYVLTSTDHIPRPCVCSQNCATYRQKVNDIFNEWISSITCRSTRGVSWSLPVFSIKKTLNSQGSLKKVLFKVLSIGFYTFCPSFRQIMDTIPKKTFSLSRQTIRRAFFRLLQNWRSAALRVSVPSMRKGDSRTGRGLESTAGAIIFPNSMLLLCSSPL